MSDDDNRTEKGIAPAPFGAGGDAATADTLAPADSPSASRTLPAVDRERYKIIGEVGRGGLGRILRARDAYLDRPVAVKELLAPDEGAQARFVREALITARLQHPAIVPIYDAGQSDDDGPFYAMKLVAGASLAEKLADKRTLEERLALLSSVIAVVDAIAYAHSEKIIHRDLKPQNVLVGNYGETVLIDWGLAKDLSAAEHQGPYRASAAASSSTETMDGAVMGTPAFMPPEQAAGEDVDEKADVYALGAMLYFLITGVPPHGGRTMDEMLLKIVRGDIVPVQAREPRCPADLAAIVAKAMAKDPADRYPSAGELADDLKKFQTGQLVGAHAYTLGERLRRWLGKHRGIVAVATVALAILIGYGLWSIQRIREREAEALAAAARADANAAEATRQKDKVLAQSMLVRARQYAATGHTAEEIAVLRALASRGAEAERMAIDDGGLIWKAHQRLAMALGAGVGIAHRTADGARFVASVPGALVTWDVASGTELARMPLDGAAARFGRILGVSPMGRFAIVNECLPPAAACGVDVILDGNVFVPRADAELRLVEIASSKVLATWTRASGPLDRRTIAFAPDDSAFVLRRARVLDIHDGTATRSVDEVSCEGALAIASPQRFAIACKDRVVLHTERGRADILRGPPPSQLVFVGADRLLAIGDAVRLWDVARGELRGEGKLAATTAQRDDEDESEDLAWSYFAPDAPKHGGGEAMAPEIRVGHALTIVPRTSVLSPPPRQGSASTLLSLEGHAWLSLAIHDDVVRYALVDQLVPAEPPDRCLSRVGGERHATTLLDNGERLLVDQQELALGLEAAPPEGYRHTTTAEVPVRQLRPLVAAETDACLIWSTWSFGAHRVDGGIIPPLAGAAADNHGGLVIAGTREAFRIAADGQRTAIEVAAGARPAPLISPSGAYVASADPSARTLVITDSATGKPLRTWTAPGTAPPSLAWIGKDVLAAFGHVIALDPAIAPRPYAGDLTTDPRSAIGVKLANTTALVQRLVDGNELAHHAAPGATAAIPLPDDSGRILVTTADTREVVALDGQRVALAPLAGEILGYDVVGTLLVAHQKTRSDAWDLATGQLLAIAPTADLVAILDDDLWLIEGKATLVRTKRDGSQRRELALQTTGLPFHAIEGDVAISADRTRLAARYAVNEELEAYAIWDAASGALLWVGPPTASIVGDWIVSGGRAFIPHFDVAAVLRDSGARTNLRVCEKDLRVVPVVPPPSPETYWAPPDACSAPPRR